MAIDLPDVVFEPGSSGVIACPDFDASDLVSAVHVSRIYRRHVDSVALLVAAAGSTGLASLLETHQSRLGAAFDLPATMIGLLVTAVLIGTLLAASRRPTLEYGIGRHLADAVPSVAIGGILVLAGWRIGAGIGFTAKPATDTVLIMCGVALVTVTLGRSGVDRVGNRNNAATRVLIVGSGAVAAQVAAELRATDRVSVVGFVDDHPLEPNPEVVGGLEDLEQVCTRWDVDHLVVAFSLSTSEEMVAALRPMHGRLPITVVPRLFDILPGSSSVHDFGASLSAISVGTCADSHGSRFLKRTIDLIGATLGILVLSPILLTTVAAIRLTSKGPALFSQRRVGRGREEFNILKFRSMVLERPQRPGLAGIEKQVPGQVQVARLERPATTPVGRVIRRWSIDELPQLWNVVTGKMSLVGPRPFVPGESASITGWAESRYSVRPGMTGLWQVSGRNDLTFDEMCRLDSFYVAHWCNALDLKILLRTVKAVASGRGVL